MDKQDRYEAKRAARVARQKAEVAEVLRTQGVNAARAYAVKIGYATYADSIRAI